MIFQYFLPAVEVKDVTPDTLREYGLGSLFWDFLRSQGEFENHISCLDVARGPSGSSGTIVAPLPLDSTIQPHIGFYPDEQTWDEITVAEERPYWLGSAKESPPGPGSLARAHVTHGLELELGDGQVWTCPTIRFMGGTPAVPCSYGVTGTGEFQQQILPDYETVWQMAGEMFDIAMCITECEQADAFGYAVRCLALNYRVGPHEVTRLRLLNTTNYMQIFKAAVDGQRIQEFIESPEGTAALRAAFGEQADTVVAKKKDEPPPDTNSSPGPPADAPATDPAAANSTS